MASSNDVPFADAANKDSEAFQRLTAAGVSKRCAARFLARARCISAREVALFLRLQLPPLQFANAPAVDAEMQDLLGITGKRARQLLQDFGVPGARIVASHKGRWLGYRWSIAVVWDQVSLATTLFLHAWRAYAMAACRRSSMQRHRACTHECGTSKLHEHGRSTCRGPPASS